LWEYAVLELIYIGRFDYLARSHSRRDGHSSREPHVSLMSDDKSLNATKLSRQAPKQESFKIWKKTIPNKPLGLFMLL
jgi:hypothetical protein